MNKQYAILPIDRVHPDPHQPRQYFDEEQLRQLGESIQENGQLQPIEVTAVGSTYLINHGERRWRASQIVGLKTIEALVVPGKAEDERLLAAIVENDHRTELPPVDLARAYQSLMDQHGWTRTRLSQRMKRSLPFIEARLAWLGLEREIQDLVNRGLLPLSPRCSKAFLSIEDSQARVLLAQKLAGSGTVSIKAVENTCAKAAHKMKKAQLAGKGVTNKQMPSLQQDPPPLARGEVPMPHLAVNGNAPVDETTTDWGTLRNAARMMCDDCFQQPNTQLAEPAWMLLRQAAHVTCSKCPAWVPGDNMLVCLECPGVIMLRQVVELVVPT